jgi:hypothetical protein
VTLIVLNIVSALIYSSSIKNLGGILHVLFVAEFYPRQIR